MPPPPTTEEGKREWLRAGTTLEFSAPPTDRKETPEEEAARTIQAAWLEALAEGHERVVRVPIRIANAIIAGPLDLSSVTFECDLSITDSEWPSVVNFAFAHFKRAVRFNGCRFRESAGFRAARADADFEINLCIFNADATFQDLHIGEVLSAQGTNFAAANFQRIDVAKSALFRTDADGNLVKFGGAAKFAGAHIGSDADFCGAQFEQEVTFDGARIDGNAFIRSDDRGNRVRFSGDARFPGAHIGGNAEFQGAEFRQNAAFDRLQVEGPAYFGPDQKDNPVSFTGEARFSGSHIGGQAVFDGVHFGGAALFHNAQFAREAGFEGAVFEQRATFDRVYIHSSVFFRPDEKGKPVRFCGEARFVGAHIGGNVEFDGTEFEKGATFDGIQIDRDAFFRTDRHGNRVKFRGNARFLGAYVLGDAEYVGARFEQEATFDGIRVDGGAIFRPDNKGQPVVFLGPASFPGAQFHSETQFTEARFEQGAEFKNAHFAGGADFARAQFVRPPEGQEMPVAAFAGARFDRGVTFAKAQFGYPAEFTYVHSAREADFRGAKFFFRAGFEEAAFQVILFREETTEHVPKDEAAQFEADLDLRGCTYVCIRAAWQELLDKLQPYDRQPYTQLEKVLRSTGHPDHADRVYYERCRAEGNRIRLWNLLGWAWDRTYRVMAGYGVRVWPLKHPKISSPSGCPAAGKSRCAIPPLRR